jgi:hypothetical protein
MFPIPSPLSEPEIYCARSMFAIVVVGVSTLAFFPSGRWNSDFLLRESRASLAAEDMPVASSSLF